MNFRTYGQRWTASPQVRKSQILGTIPLWQIREFLWCANPKNPQIRTFHKILHNSVSKQSLYSRLCKHFFMYTFEIEHNMLYFVRKKAYACGLVKVLCPQITKNTDSANRKSAKCHNFGRSANQTSYLSPQFCWFAIAGLMWKKRTKHLVTLPQLLHPTSL